MDFLARFLANEHVQSLILAAFGFVFTYILHHAAAAFKAATGIQIEAAHRVALHQAVMTAVESAMRHGAKEGTETLKVHVVQHLKESVPDALKALTPHDGVIDNLIERFTFETLARFGERK